MGRYLSTTEVADIFEQPAWRIRRLYEDGILPEPGRLGICRAIPASSLPDIASALRSRGWLPETEAVAS